MPETLETLFALYLGAKLDADSVVGRSIEYGKARILVTVFEDGPEPRFVAEVTEDGGTNTVKLESRNPESIFDYIGSVYP